MKVNPTPTIPRPVFLATFSAVQAFATSLVLALASEMTTYATLLNGIVDGTAGPLKLPSYAKTALPVAADYLGGMIYVTNDVGGATPAFSDGTNWRRTADRNVIS